MAIILSILIAFEKKNGASSNIQRVDYENGLAFASVNAELKVKCQWEVQRSLGSVLRLSEGKVSTFSCEFNS